MYVYTHQFIHHLLICLWDTHVNNKRTWHQQMVQTEIKLSSIHTAAANKPPLPQTITAKNKRSAEQRDSFSRRQEQTLDPCPVLMHKHLPRKRKQTWIPDKQDGPSYAQTHAVWLCKFRPTQTQTTSVPTQTQTRLTQRNANKSSSYIQGQTTHTGTQTTIIPMYKQNLLPHTNNYFHTQTNTPPSEIQA